MSQEDSQTDPQAEKVLRQWGAQDAASRVNVPPMRDYDNGSGFWQVVRWLVPLAAVAALIIFAGWLTLRPPASAENSRQLEEQLSRAKEKSSKNWAAWVESQTQLQEQRNRTVVVQSQLQALQTRRDSGTESVKELQRQVAELTAGLQRQKQQLEVSQAALTAAVKAVKTPPPAPAVPAAPSVDVAALQDKVIQFQARVSNYEDRLAATSGELVRLRAQIEEMTQKVQKAQEEAILARATAAKEFELVQAAYLSVSAPTEQGLRARQSACRRSRLIQRVTALRRGDLGPDLGASLDRLEVVLSKLEMMDVNDPRAGAALAKLAAASDLANRLDNAIGLNTGSAELKSVLAEAKLVVFGLENLG